MLLKCCTQHASKFGKLSSGHKAGKGHFSFQSQRQTIPESIPAAIQLWSLHILARLCSKSFTLGFRSTWTKNFQVYWYSLGYKKQKNEIKLPTFVGSWRKQGSFRKTPTSASLSTLKPLTVWIPTNWKILTDGSARPPYPSPEKSVWRSRSNS